MLDWSVRGRLVTNYHIYARLSVNCGNLIVFPATSLNQLAIICFVSRHTCMWSTPPLQVNADSEGGVKEGKREREGLQPSPCHIIPDFSQ